MQLFQYISNELTGVLSSYVGSTSGGLIAQFVNVAIVGCTFYYMVLAYQMIAGLVDMPFKQFAKTLFKFTFIAFIALNAANYNFYVVSFMEGLKETLLITLGGTDVTPGNPNVYAVIDGKIEFSFNVASQTFANYWGKGFEESILAIIFYIVIVTASIIIIIPTGAMILVADICLSILLGIGPIFIMCLMWTPTARFFETWIGATLGYVLRIALLTAAMSLAMHVFTVFLHDANQASMGSSKANPYFIVGVLICSAIALKWMILEINAIAAQLSGGVSAAAITATGMVMGAIAPAAAAYKIAKGLKGQKKDPPPPPKPDGGGVAPKPKAHAT